MTHFMCYSGGNKSNWLTMVHVHSTTELKSAYGAFQGLSYNPTFKLDVPESQLQAMLSGVTSEFQ